jgi:hypothetical protein
MNYFEAVKQLSPALWILGLVVLLAVVLFRSAWDAI